LFDRRKACAHHRIGRRQADGEIGERVFSASDVKSSVAPLLAIPLRKRRRRRGEIDGPPAAQRPIDGLSYSNMPRPCSSSKRTTRSGA
jgi:hypothetical protein